MNITEWNKEDWDDFISDSPYSTPFSSSEFLSLYDLPVRYFKCEKGNEIVAGLACIENEDKKIKVMPFQAYSGIVLAKNFVNNSVYRKIEMQYACAEAFAEFLFLNFKHFECDLHWEFKDIRPFDWYNYQQKNLGSYSTVIKYTSLLDISKGCELERMARGRRTDLKKFFNSCLTKSTFESFDIDAFDKLHALTFKRQGIERSDIESNLVTKIIDKFLAINKGKLFITNNENNAIAGSFIIYDKYRAYFMFGASDPEARVLDAFSGNLYFAINESSKLVSGFDFVGTNSPHRGRFKLSYGGNLVPYFSIKNDCLKN